MLPKISSSKGGGTDGSMLAYGSAWDGNGPNGSNPKPMKADDGAGCGGGTSCLMVLVAWLNPKLDEASDSQSSMDRGNTLASCDGSQLDGMLRFIFVWQCVRVIVSVAFCDELVVK